jgi:hypothetical protein
MSRAGVAPDDPFAAEPLPAPDADATTPTETAWQAKRLLCSAASTAPTLLNGVAMAADEARSGRSLPTAPPAAAAVRRRVVLRSGPPQIILAHVRARSIGSAGTVAPASRP